PAVLHRVVDAIEIREHGADALARGDLGPERDLIHAGGVGKLGVVVIPEDVVEGARSRAMWVDVRVRIDQRNEADFREQILCEFVEELHGRKSIRASEFTACLTKLRRFYKRSALVNPTEWTPCHFASCRRARGIPGESSRIVGCAASSAR